MKSEHQNNLIMLSFDLEYWWGSQALKDYLPSYLKEQGDFLIESVEPILVLLKKYQAKATFFTTGAIMEKYPELIKQISRDGHQIAFHTFDHSLLSELSPVQFQKEISQAKKQIKELTSQNLKGFRAPSFSLTQQTKWALPILANEGLVYDSSIFPIKTPLYGLNKAPNKFYHISFSDITKEDNQSPLLEIPMTLAQIGPIKIPVGGGVYFRLLPFWLFKQLLKLAQKQRQVVLYFHPHELFAKTPRIPGGPLWKRALKYYGQKNCLAKFEKLLANFQFNSVENILGL